MGYAFFVFMLAAALVMLLFDSAASAGAAEGLKLFAGSALPCLFPFMVCGQYFIAFADKGGGAFARGRPQGRLGRALKALFEAALCAVCGTPAAAMICERKRKAGLSARRASALCAAMNQVSPVFIIGFVASGLMKKPELWWVFAVSHYLPAALASLLLGITRGEEAGAPELSVSMTEKRPSALLGSAIKNACSAALRVGGTIVFFRVLISVAGEAGLETILGRAPFAFAAGIAEMTNGLSLIAALHLDARVCASLLCFAAGFGGVCVYMQSAMFFEELRPLPYFAVKLAEGAASFLLCMALFPAGPEAAAVFYEAGYEALPRSTEVLERGVIMLYAFMSFALAGAFSYLYSRLFIRRRTV